MDELNYQSGFGNHFSSEAIAGILPTGQNSPQKLPMDLYAEQISGSAFTAPKGKNLRSWLYKKKPSAAAYKFQPYSKNPYLPLQIDELQSPEQLRWDPIKEHSKDNFFMSLFPYTTQGSYLSKSGSTNYFYSFSHPSEKEVFKNSDAEMLIIPVEGKILAKTELGFLSCAPGEIIVIPRGIHFSLQHSEQIARGYACENYGHPFELPDRGAIGANGLANERDFKYPTAFFEDTEENYTLINKFAGKLWTANLPSSPFDVIAWHGNYAPYKYDLYQFNVIGSISFDHPDPSIFTVLTSPSHDSGIANIDFVIFPPRWLVANKTFRPPYYHRNTMSEFMGNIHGEYDAKPGSGFSPGSASLHNGMAPHGPSKSAFDKATENQLNPEYLDKTMSFMLESYLPYQVCSNALKSSALQSNYPNCWKGF